jgi:hypothetical protein
MNNGEKVLLYFSIGFAILLPFGILKYIAREKLAASAYQHPEVKRKMLRYLKRLVPLLRIFLLLSPVYLILVPWLLSEYSDLRGVTVFSCMALMLTNVFVEYRFREWLYHYLENNLA